ncbi:MAG: D-glycero-beta-D-manno-heptose-7-phosphate kinase [Elusimicrobiota bacterium]
MIFKKSQLKNFRELIEKFSKRKILVVGDLMVDEFIWGNVGRISPEAPVPVVEITRETMSPGGAGNVVNNLSHLGAKVYAAGWVGKDVAGDFLLNQFAKLGVDTQGVFRDEHRPTIRKTRIVAQHQQVVRVDREIKGEVHLSLNNNLKEYLKKIIPQVEAVIISDYGKGVINRSLLETALKSAKRFHRPLTVDPKIEHFLRYRRVTCITPNLLEAAQGMHAAMPKDANEVNVLAEKILRRLKSHSVLITQGEKGMTLFEKDGSITHIPTVAREVFDVTGAGDTVISVLTLALAGGAKPVDAAYLANYAAGIVVGKLGTAVVSPEELWNVINSGD